MPVQGKDYPGSYAELRAWFPNDRDCLDYLDWLRWGAGFACPHCGNVKSWHLPDGRRSCAGCDYKISPTAGTIFHRTRTPLTLWFAAAWHLTSQKNGVSATYLKRVLGFGSYQTPWAMLHRYRTAMVRPDRNRLRGTVEMDESFVGGKKSGPPGRGARGKTMIGIAVERSPGSKGLGRCRVAILPDASAQSLRAFLKANVEPGSTLVTDGWPSYPAATKGLYTHVPVNVSGLGQPAHIPLPGVHRVASLTKRWILGTHQGSIESDHLAAYLDEFTFRFNRRSSKARGLLFYRLMDVAVRSPERSYASLVANPGRAKRKKPAAPTSRRVPPSIVMTVPDRPWRV
jgi:transposase-like protein